MSDDEEQEAAALSFADPSQAIVTGAGDPSAAADDDDFDNDDAAEVKKSRKRKAPTKNAPLDADGLPMEWDAAAGAWVQSVGYTAEAEKLSEQWIQTRLSQTLMHVDKLRSGGGVHGTYCRAAALVPPR